MPEFTKRLRKGAQALIEQASDLQERIRQRAHAIWEREGRPSGRDQDHWRDAESELARDEAAAAPARPAAKKPRAAKSGAKSTATPAKRARAAKPAASATGAAAGAKRSSAAASPEPAAPAPKPRRAPRKKDG